MKAIVKTQFKILEGIFDIGDKVDIISILSDRDVVLSSNRVYSKGIDSIGREYSKSTLKHTISPAGSYTGFRIQSKTGNYYNDHDFINLIGYKSLGDIFNKVEN